MDSRRHSTLMTDLSSDRSLGPSVNTPDTDTAPAFPPDGETITWFSYRTDNTLGPSDIFWASKKKLGPSG